MWYEGANLQQNSFKLHQTECSTVDPLCDIVSKLGSLVKASPNFLLCYSKRHGGWVGITDIPEHLPVFQLGTENVVG